MPKMSKGRLGETTQHWLEEQHALAKHQARMQALHQKWLTQIGELAVHAGFTHDHDSVLPEVLRMAKLAMDEGLHLTKPEVLQEAVGHLVYALTHAPVYAVLREAVVAHQSQESEEA